MTWIGSPNYTAGRGASKITGIVIHWIVGTLASADATFRNSGSQVSAHYGIENGTVHQYVKDSDTAWHAGNFSVNQRTIGIEHSAAPGRNASASTMETSAKLIADLSKKYGFAINSITIIPHSSVKATQCPGTIDINWLINRANQLKGGGIMTIRQMLVDPSKYALKCPYAMTPQYITIHNTANNASANNEISYMRSNASSTGFHIAVDDKEAVQGIPLNRNSFNAGDGNGNGNRNSIAIEICYSKSGGARFNQAEANAAKLTAQLLKERGWDISRVRKHQDWSGKYCPHRTLDMGWTRFLNMIQAELTPKPIPAPVPKVTYALIPKKSIVLIRDANLWDFNFTNWNNAKAVKGYKSGDKIDNIVAIATNSLGAKYYVTEYAYGKKNTHGFNINDARDYTEPAPVPIPTPEPPKEPEPTPEPPVTELPDYPKENNALLKQILALLQSLVDKITSIFK